MRSRYPKDLSGMSFGRLTVIGPNEFNLNKKRTGSKWICQCSCGNTRVVYRSNLTSGDSTSCGCYLKERVSTHGLSKHRLYGIWLDIRKRCLDDKTEAYQNYGGRGIVICDEWQEFIEFYNWSVNNGYKENLTLDRIDNDGNYYPENCRWVTRYVQNNNTRRNVFVEFHGQKMTIAQLAKNFNLSPKTVGERYKNGYTGDDLVARPHTLKRKRRETL